MGVQRDFTFSPTQGLSQYMPLAPLAGTFERTSVLQLVLMGDVVNFGQYQRTLLQRAIAEKLNLAMSKVSLTVQGGSVTVFVTIKGATQMAVESMMAQLASGQFVPLPSFPLISAQEVTAINAPMSATATPVAAPAAEQTYLQGFAGTDAPLSAAAAQYGVSVLLVMLAICAQLGQ
jgi:hypothetical protein